MIQHLTKTTTMPRRLLNVNRRFGGISRSRRISQARIQNEADCIHRDTANESDHIPGEEWVFFENTKYTHIYIILRIFYE
jgi:hypothetical protein